MHLFTFQLVNIATKNNTIVDFFLNSPPKSLRHHQTFKQSNYCEKRYYISTIKKKSNNLNKASEKQHFTVFFAVIYQKNGSLSTHTNGEKLYLTALVCRLINHHKGLLEDCVHIRFILVSSTSGRSPHVKVIQLL